MHVNRQSGTYQESSELLHTQLITTKFQLCNEGQECAEICACKPKNSLESLRVDNAGSGLAAGNQKRHEREHKQHQVIGRS